MHASNARKLNILEKLEGEKKGLVGIELEVKMGEADLLFSRNKTEVKILREGLP